MTPDEALLRFVLCPDLEREARLALWQRWADAGDIDDHSSAAYDLFPAVYAALHDLDVDHRWIGRLKGVYRQAWTRNTLQRRTLADAAAVLDRSGIDHLDPRVGGGEDTLPLNEPTPRLIVRWHDAGRARDALLEAGWQIGSAPDGGLGHLGVIQRFDRPFESPDGGGSLRGSPACHLRHLR